MNVYGELSICSDCLIWQSNGDDSAFSDSASAEVHNEAVRTAPMVVVIGDDLGFSWSSCDVCHEGLGGDRFSAVTA
jgi:hypothetical protein